MGSGLRPWVLTHPSISHVSCPCYKIMYELQCSTGHHVSTLPIERTYPSPMYIISLACAVPTICTHEYEPISWINPIPYTPCNGMSMCTRHMHACPCPCPCLQTPRDPPPCHVTTLAPCMPPPPCFPTISTFCTCTPPPLHICFLFLFLSHV